MLILSTVLLVVGSLISLVGGILFLIAAFRVSARWGLAVLLIPFAFLVFLFKHWPAAKRPFLIQVAGAVLLGLAAGASAAGGAGHLHEMVLGSNEYTIKELGATEASAPEAAKPAAAAPDHVIPELPDPKSMIGKTLVEAEKVFGKPTGTMETRNVKSFFYNGFWLYSKDGKIISDVELDSDFKSLRTAVTNLETASSGLRVRLSQPEPAEARPAQYEPIKIVSGDGQRVELASLLVPGKVTMVDFFADWCGPCRQLAPYLEKMVKEDPDVAMRKVNIVRWGTPVCEQYQIQSVPNVRVFDRKGKMVGVPSHDPRIIRDYIRQAKE